ncbi:MAG: helicase-related protein, partial [Armatimonadota bacterium]
GHNFRPDYLVLADAARAIGAERVLALTATATPAVVADIQSTFAIADEDVVTTGFHRPNLILRATACRAAERAERLVERLKCTPPGPTIVYVTLQRTAEQLAEQLRAAGFPAEAYHAGMDTEVRSSVQERWMRSDEGIVVATIAFGMGIDKADVRRVFHANVPKSLESYSQEVGRAGRDGRDAVCEVFASPEDLPALRNFAYGDTPSLLALEKLLADLSGRGETFDLSLHALGGAHDIRPLVLRTLLTYLELDGVLKQGTPFHAGYEWRLAPGASVESVSGEFGAHAGEVRSVFGAARKGRIWWSGDPTLIGEATGLDRGRVVRMLEVLSERGLIELRTADVRLPFTRQVPADRLAAAAPDLYERFAARERSEVGRIDATMALLVGDPCLAAGIAAHFGDHSVGRCGRCSKCEGEVEALPAVSQPVDWDPSVLERVLELARRQPAALGEARQRARFLCGISSPAATRARLGGHPLMGIWSDRDFP